MESYDDVGEIMLADEESPAVTDIRTRARELLLDSVSRFESSSGEEDWSEIYASYVCGAADLGAPDSRFVGIVYDPVGILVVGRSLENDEPLVVVNFFSHVINEAGVRLEGVETDASEAELVELARIMKHPSLVDTAGSAPLTVRHMPLIIKLFYDYASLRQQAGDKFLARKTVELEENVSQLPRLTKRERELEDELEVLNTKIDHPVRAVMSEMVQPFSSKLARRILGI